MIKMNTPLRSTCAVSVVIPMYNAEKYIVACLGSILSQTFQDFEVVVVDDCSTDNSVAQTESLLPYFGGRLKIFHMKKNSGGPGEPTNKGIAYSTGKYILAIDNDDLILSNALESLYTLAENFHADVVHMNKYLAFNVGVEEPFPKNENIFPVASRNANLMTEPTLETNDITERIKKFCTREIEVEGWRNFVRRDFLIENDITFPNLQSSQDMVWVTSLLCFSKNFLRISYPFYVKRWLNTSITGRGRSKEQNLKFWLKTCLTSQVTMIKNLHKQGLFADNSEVKFQLSDYFFQRHFEHAAQDIFRSQPLEIYEALEETFNENSSEYNELTLYIFTMLNFWLTRYMAENQRANQLELQLKTFFQEGN